MSEEVVVPLGGRSYPVVVETGAYAGLGPRLVERVGRRRAILVTEERVEPLWGPAVRAALAGHLEVETVVLPAGEAHKTVETWSGCVDARLERGVDRKTPILALGGGVLGDVAGFAAAATLRGLPFVQLPTTLLAMVDSSVGGKTGVNHRWGKNLIGAFHQPRLVYAALATLDTLPPEERIAGLGEVVKMALLGDAALLTRLEAEAERLRAGDPEVLAPVIARCVTLKAEVVGRDEREAGWRAVLNAGHTVGHAYEAACGFGVLRHGEAVALGLLAETRWAVAAGHCVDVDLPERLARLLTRLGLPTRPPRASRERLLAAIRMDKKAHGDMLALPIPVRAGHIALLDVPVAEVGELFPEGP